MESTGKFKEQLKSGIYTFVIDLVNFVTNLNQRNSFARICSDQLLRSGTSVGANYIEAIAGSSRKDFANFLSHSLKSANESKFWLSLILDTKRGSKEQVVLLVKELTEISNILGASLRTMKRNS